MLSRKGLIAVSVGTLLGALVLASLWRIREKEQNPEPVSRDLNDGLRLARINSVALEATFNILKLFKQENGYFPPEDNRQVVTALFGRNKSTKNYIPEWSTLDYQKRLVDVYRKPLVFHFVNDNEVTIYSPGTGQRLDGFLDTGKVTIN